MVTPFLQQAGHDVVAPDLPSDDGSADFDTYADMMCSALQGRDDDVVVVGNRWAVPRRRWSPLGDPFGIWCICAQWF